MILNILDTTEELLAVEGERGEEGEVIEERVIKNYKKSTFKMFITNFSLLGAIQKFLNFLRNMKIKFPQQPSLPSLNVAEGQFCITLSTNIFEQECRS